MKFGVAVQALCDAGVDFVVIGGVAGNLHGSATVTFDLDIWLLPQLKKSPPARAGPSAISPAAKRVPRQPAIHLGRCDSA